MSCGSPKATVNSIDPGMQTSRRVNRLLQKDLN